MATKRVRRSTTKRINSLKLDTIQINSYSIPETISYLPQTQSCFWNWVPSVWFECLVLVVMLLPALFVSIYRFLCCRIKLAAFETCRTPAHLLFFPAISGFFDSARLPPARLQPHFKYVWSDQGLFCRGASLILEVMFAFQTWQVWTINNNGILVAS